MDVERGNLKIRLLDDEDGPILHRWLNDPQVLAYYEGRDKPQCGFEKTKLLPRREFHEGQSTIVGLWKS